MRSTQRARASPCRGLPRGRADRRRDIRGGDAVGTLVISEVYGGGGNSRSDAHQRLHRAAEPRPARHDLTGCSVQYHSSSGDGSWQVTTLSGIDRRRRASASSGGGRRGRRPRCPRRTTPAASTCPPRPARSRSSTPPPALTCADRCPRSSQSSTWSATAPRHPRGRAGAPALPTPRLHSARRRRRHRQQRRRLHRRRHPTRRRRHRAAVAAARAAAHPRHPGQRAGSRRTTATRSRTCRASSPPCGRPAARASGCRTRHPTPTRPRARASSCSPAPPPAVAVGDSVLVSGKVSDFYPLSSGETVAHDVQPVDHRDRHRRRRPCSRTATRCPPRSCSRPDIVPGHVRARPRRRQHRVHPDHPSGPRSTSTSRSRACGSRSTTRGWSARRTPSASSTSRRKPNQAATYRGGTELLGENKIPSGRLEVVAGGRREPGRWTSATCCRARRSARSTTRLRRLRPRARRRSAPRHNHLPPVERDAPGRATQLSIATYNVENLAPSRPAVEVRRASAQGVVTNLASPDIVAARGDPGQHRRHRRRRRRGRPDADQADRGDQSRPAARRYH